MPDCIFSSAVVPVLRHIIPDVQMERDMILDSEQTVLCNLKYAVLFRTIPMLYQLAVQKALRGRKRERERDRGEGERDRKGEIKGKRDGWLPKLRADRL